MNKSKFKIGDVVLVVRVVGAIEHNCVGKVGKITGFIDGEEFTYPIKVSGLNSKEFNEKELLKLDNKLAKLFYS